MKISLIQFSFLSAVSTISLIFLSSIAFAQSTPVPQVAGSNVTWQAVSANTINVHSSDGSYVTTLSGSATSWEASEPGSYFLVSTNSGHWSTWPKSSVFTLEDPGVEDPEMALLLVTIFTETGSS